uniref:protein-L-isoaspartate O-methyltransferase family protein n=1 Tax=Pararhizobium sp. IMCC3301 TaxID=3067904 RepID=UPI0027418D53|nr:protein-L-isoaspartate O-methyltransferase [Pararhizobium sp. IMCC3301]
MTDFADLRKNMVEHQLRTNDVTSSAVLDRFGQLAREIFVPADRRAFAYTDSDVPVWNNGSGEQRYLMEAYPFARLVQAAQLKPSDLVLDIGCGTGYSTAILAGFCESVVAIESAADLVDIATGNLMDLKIDNAVVLQSELHNGYAKEGPYDVIIINGAVDEVPPVLFDQLRSDGRLLSFVGHGHSGNLSVFRKTGAGATCVPIINASVPPMPGFERVESFVF